MADFSEEATIMPGGGISKRPLHVIVAADCSGDCAEIAGCGDDTEFGMRDNGDSHQTNCGKKFFHNSFFNHLN